MTKKIIDTDRLFLIHKNDIGNIISEITDYNLYGEEDLNPLEMAVYVGNSELVTAMLIDGADININRLSKNGQTILEQAITGAYGPDEEIVRILLDHGADTQLKNTNGKNALEMAEILLANIDKAMDPGWDYNYKNCIKILKEKNPEPTERKKTKKAIPKNKNITPHIDNIDDTVIAGILIQDLIRTITEDLSKLERKVIYDRYCLEKSIKSIGKELGKTYDQTRGVIEKALRKLRHPNRTIKYKALWDDMK